MIGYEYTITNRSGDSFKINDFSTDPDNFIGLQQYPDMEIDVKNNEVALEGQHGIWDFFSYFGKRMIAFNGVIVGEDEEQVEILRNTIVQVLRLPMQPTDSDDGYVTISWTDATGSVWSFEAKIARSPKFSRNMHEDFKLEFLLTFKTDNPFILSAEAIDEEGVRGYFAYGVKFPLELPAQMGLVAINGIDIENGGTMAAHTIIRLYGEAGGVVTNPTIQNITTGKTFTVEVELADDTEYVEIDSQEGTVVDQDGNDLSADIDDESEFILLQPGENTLIYTADDEQRDPAGGFSVVFRSTKI